MCIKQAKTFFNIDAGHSEAKKAHLGDIKSTKIESPGILYDFLFDKNMTFEQKQNTILFANVKAMIPLIREKFLLEYEDLDFEKYE